MERKGSLDICWGKESTKGQEMWCKWLDENRSMMESNVPDSDTVGVGTASSVSVPPLRAGRYRLHMISVAGVPRHEIKTVVPVL